MFETSRIANAEKKLSKEVTITGTDFMKGITEAREEFKDLPFEVQMVLMMYGVKVMNIVMGYSDSEDE